jgi:hypothetical protein
MVRSVGSKQPVAVEQKVQLFWGAADDVTR